jgi:hypothetical protein
MAVTIAQPQLKKPTATGALPSITQPLNGFKGFNLGGSSFSNVPNFNSVPNQPSIAKAGSLSGGQVNNLSMGKPDYPLTSLNQKPPANPAATKVKPPMASTSSTGSVSGPIAPAQPYGGKLNPADPAAVGGTLMNSSSTSQNTSTIAPPAPAAPVAPAAPTNSNQSSQPSAFQSQLDALKKAQQDYASSFSLSPDILSTQGQLNDITSRQAMLNANEKAGEANVQDQPIAMSLIGGQQAALQRQLAAQQGQQAALAIPLQQKLALAQMQREAAQKQTQAQLQNQQSLLDLNKGVAVAPGTSLVQPYTGSELFSGIGGLQGKSALDTFYNLQQTYPDAAIQWDNSKSPQENLAAAQQAASKSPNYQAKANSFSVFTTPGGGQSIINTKTGQPTSTLSTPEQGASANANAASLKTQQVYSDNITGAFNTANSNLATITNLMQKYGLNQSNVPIVNQLNNNLKAQADPGAIGAFNAAIKSVRGEYARVLAKGGEVTDKDNANAASLIPDNISPQDLNKVAAQLQAEAKNAISAANQNIQDIQGRLNQSSSQDTSSSGGFNW